MSTRKHVVYWHETEPVVPEPPLRENVDCDIAVVGGGYTGLWAAHFLKEAEPALDIRVVEAEFAGHGASGRADGFVTPTIGKDIQALVKEFGTRRALEASQAVGRSVLEIGRFTRRNKIDAEYEANDYLMVATTQAQLRRLRADRDLATRIAGRDQPPVLSPADAQEVIGSPAVLGAMRTGGALVNPFKLARGVARVVKERGVVVHENTPVVRVRPGVRPQVVTPGGTITADKVIVAANARQFTFQQFRNKTVPLWSYAMVSEPLTTEQLGRIAWAGREGMVEAKTFLTCARFTADNRLLWAGGPAFYFWGRDLRRRRMNDQRAYRALAEEFGRFFPMWRDLKFTYTYGGVMDITRDYAPHFGALPGGNIFYGYGFNGNGIAATHTGGKVLRDLVLGKDSEFSRLLYVDDAQRSARDFPPEPLLYVGARATTRLMEWKESRA
ncbi:FAD-binding oxidoreductase [Streptomyces tubbatahanensis]|uniref:FAD-binding oxidoreductase n=1 Tax=Streptomyces tubbatahanensis TaxID=2923272 RepID=A0ABY3XX79_9ACTN|nr:FAD-binding oxidoreductase [Streptomyces tubbatahanensis]UNS99109.1 FAD-binding oxidoreductase [Streptomyces tubbatahanensis]